MPTLDEQRNDSTKLPKKMICRDEEGQLMLGWKPLFVARANLGVQTCRYGGTREHCFDLGHHHLRQLKTRPAALSWHRRRNLTGRSDLNV